jgi:excisionase family DNA binding protein
MESMSVAEAAKASGFSTSTIKRRITAGDIKAAMDEDGRYVIARDDLMAYLVTQKPKDRSGATVQSQPGPGSDAISTQAAQMIQLLRAELDSARSRIREVEARNDQLQGELLSLMHELGAVLSGSAKKGGLSAWFGKVRG